MTRQELDLHEKLHGPNGSAGSILVLVMRVGFDIMTMSPNTAADIQLLIAALTGLIPVPVPPVPLMPPVKK